MARLLTPWKVGPLLLKNRIVLAPLTRNRATHPERVPTPLMAEMYAARADAGLLITEATDIMDNNHGYPATPGVYNDAQVAGWKTVTDAVHAKGGHIFVQLWHQGRTANPELSGGTSGVISASAIDGWIDGMGNPAPAPREATQADIDGVVAAYAAASRNAIAGGFDGVEVHAANGYLINQFICSGSNIRTDGYGGSAANRARLLREVVAACAAAIGPERVGVRVSPSGGWQGMSDAEPVETWTQVIADLAAAGPLAYLHIIEPRDSGFGAPADPRMNVLTHAWARAQGFTQPIITAGGYTDFEGAGAAVSEGADAVAFGRLFIANPDLVARARRAAAGLPVTFNRWDRSTFYGGGAEGYTTGYPLLEE